jgi:hypothetical protein
MHEGFFRLVHSQEIFLCEPLESKARRASVSFPRYPRLNRCDRELRAHVNRGGWRRFFLHYRLILMCLPFVFTGCTQRINLGAPSSSGSGSLEVLPGAVNFGSVAVGQSASSGVSLVNEGSAAVQVLSVSETGQSFSVSGAGDLPITVAAGATYILNVNFAPTATGAAAGQLTITSNSQSGGTMAVSLSGTGAAGSSTALSGLGCVGVSYTGAATDNCDVTMSGAAGSGGVMVALSSNNGAVTVPSTVMVPAGATSASFTASVNAVSSAQTATLTASAGGVSESLGLELGASSIALSASTTNVAFGNVNVNTTSTQQVTLTSTGNAAVTISSVTISGSGFSVSGISTPQTLNPNQTMILNVGFDPATTGSATGQINIVDNASGGSLTVNLSGTGTILLLPALNSLSCSSASFMGPSTDGCTVTMNSAAPAGGISVNLASTNAAVAVPAAVEIPAGASSASFTATVAAVTTAQTATLIASTGNSSEAFVLQLGAYVPTLTVSSTNLAFGSVAIGSTTAQSLVLTSTGTAYVTVNAATINGSGFSASGASFPLTLSPNQTATLTVQFDPTAAAAAAGTLSLTSNSSTGSPTVVSLSGTGVPVLSGLTCASSSVTGAGTDSCTVAINGVAPGSGLSVSLVSNDSAITMPASVTVAAGATSASFTSNAAAVSTSQVATLTASAGGVTETFALQLNVPPPQVSVSATSLNFGNVSLNAPATQEVTLSSSSVLPITVSLATVTGPGFSLTGGTLPLILITGQSATFTVQFDPTALGAASGTLTIISTSLTNPTTVVNLSGTGVVAYQVNLSWDAPVSSSDPVAGYNIYRIPSGGTSYQLLNPSIVTQTAFTDTTVQDGQTYNYIVESVDATGNTGAPSNVAVATIP